MLLPLFQVFSKFQKMVRPDKNKQTNLDCISEWCIDSGPSTRGDSDIYHRHNVRWQLSDALVTGERSLNNNYGPSEQQISVIWGLPLQSLELRSLMLLCIWWKSCQQVISMRTLRQSPEGTPRIMFAWFPGLTSSHLALIAVTTGYSAPHLFPQQDGGRGVSVVFLRYHACCL